MFQGGSNGSSITAPVEETIPAENQHSELTPDEARRSAFMERLEPGTLQVLNRSW